MKTVAMLLVTTAAVAIITTAALAQGALGVPL